MNVIEKVSSNKVDNDALRNNGIEIIRTLTVRKSIQTDNHKCCRCYDITKIKDFPIDKFKYKISFSILSTTNYCSNEEFIISKKLAIYNNTTEQKIILHLPGHNNTIYIKYDGFADPTIVAEIRFCTIYNRIYTLYKIDENTFHIKAEFSDARENIKLLYVLKDDTLTTLK